MVLLEIGIFIGFHGNREITGVDMPEGLLFRIGHELDECPCRFFFSIRMSAEHPQGTASNDHAALRAFRPGQKCRSDFELAADSGDDIAENACRIDGHGSLSADKGFLGIGCFTADIAGDAFLDHPLPPGKNFFAFGRIESRRGRHGCATVFIIGVERILNRHQLLEKPAINGDRDSRPGHFAACILYRQFARRSSHFFKSFGRFGRIQSCRLQHVYVVIKNRRGRIKRHGIQFVIHCIVRQQIRFERLQIDLVCIDPFLHRHHRFAVDHEAAADVIYLHDMRCGFGNNGLFQFVDGIIIGALENSFHENFLLGSIEFVDKSLRRLRYFTANRIPENDLDGFFFVCFGLFATAATHGANHEQDQDHETQGFFPVHFSFPSYFLLLLILFIP